MDILEIKNVAYSYANSKEKVLSGVMVLCQDLVQVKMRFSPF